MYQKGRCIPSSILGGWDAKKNAINGVTRSVDAGEALGLKVRLARPCKLTKAQVKKVTF